MKILAIEKEVEGANWESQEETLREEARKVYQLYLSGNLREIYFTQEKEAVLILECDSLQSAKEFLNTLPLVQKNLISFDVKQLMPYTGLNRLF